MRRRRKQNNKERETAKRTCRNLTFNHAAFSTGSNQNKREGECGVIKKREREEAMEL